MTTYESDLAFRSLVDSVGAIVWEAIPGREPGSATFTFVSEATETLLGYPASRWLSDSRFWFEIVHPDDRERVGDQIAEAVRTGRGADFEFRAMTADGREVWLRNIVQSPGAGPEPARLRGVVVDVSDRRAAEARLHRLHELTGSLSGLLTAQEVAAVVAGQGRAAVGASAVAVFLRVGDELEIAGYDGDLDEDVDPYCRIPVTHPVPAAEAVVSRGAMYLSGAETDERYPSLSRGRRLSGTGQFAAIPLDADGQVFGSLAVRMPGDRPLDVADRVVLDVLARACAQALQRAAHVSAEREARRSAEEANALLDTIIVTAPDGFALFDRDLRYVRVNDALARINGRPAQAHIGRTAAEMLPGIPDDGVAGPLRRVFETGEPVVDMEVTGVTAADPDRLATWLVSYYPVPGADGEVAWAGALVVDITERKRAEERAELLAELGAILDDVVVLESRLARLVDVLVPRLADSVSVLLRTEDGALQRMAVGHVDRSLEQVLAAAAPPEPVHESTLSADGSTVLVPMIVGDRHIGLLALGIRRARAFGKAEIALAEEVAARAALAVDNAQLYESERAARDRTSRLHAVATALAEALTAEQVAESILDHVLPAIGADRGIVWQTTEDETAIETLAWRGMPAGLMADYERVDLRLVLPVTDALRERTTVWLESTEAHLAAYPEIAHDILRAGSVATITVPLLAAGRAIGAMTLSFTRPRRFHEDDRELVAALAAQCAQALERARLFEAERRVAVTLQRSLLPTRLPDVDGIEIAVRYLPAAGLEAGGDFYEALVLPCGHIGVAVGDVVGRGAPAAAAMGQLRSALRAFAMIGHAPVEVLSRLSAFSGTVEGAMASTAVFARLDPATGELCYACAGHPWPLLVSADGSADYLRDGRGVPLGCLPDPQFSSAETTLEPGGMLLLYTDGLTERRGEDMAEVHERLRCAVGSRQDRPLGEILDDIVDELGPDAPLDDVALLAIRRAKAPQDRRVVFAADPASVPVARAQLRLWLADARVAAADAADVLLAAGEAVANAVEHAYTGAVGDVELEFAQRERGMLEISVRDRGAWREAEPNEERGRGFDLMRMLMDDVDVDASATGTTVRMRRSVDIAGAPEREPEPARARHAGGCRVSVDGGVATLSGELDMTSGPAVRARLIEAAANGPLTVDLTGLDYLDSTGLRLLLALGQGASAGLVIVAPPGTAPRRALALSRLEELLDVRDEPPA